MSSNQDLPIITPWDIAERSGVDNQEVIDWINRIKTETGKYPWGRTINITWKGDTHITQYKLATSYD